MFSLTLSLSFSLPSSISLSWLFSLFLPLFLSFSLPFWSDLHPENCFNECRNPDIGCGREREKSLSNETRFFGRLKAPSPERTNKHSGKIQAKKIEKDV